MKMVSFLLLSALVLLGPTSCKGQESLTVSLHMNGITGTSVFTWKDTNLTVIITLLNSIGTGPGIVEIRPIWVDYDVADKCSPTQLGVTVPGWTANMDFTNNTAVAIFQNVESLASLEGYSIVLSGSNKTVCASIESGQAHTTAVAQFQDLVQGTVYFRQPNGSSSTRVVTDLFSTQSSYKSSWFISDTVGNCSLVTSMSQLTVFNPTNSAGSGCAETSQQSCAVGQLSGKLGNVTIGEGKMTVRVAYTDRNLPSVSAINSKLLIIETPNKSLACAVIRVFSERTAMVDFNHDGVTGSVTFIQASPFDPTTTQINLNGLNSSAKGYHVHLWPTRTQIVNGQDLCGATVVSGHFNPYNKNVSDPSYPAPDNSTDDMYEVGDLSSKYGTLENHLDMTNSYVDWNLPLYGQNSIIGRSLVIHRNDPSGSRWVCANIQPAIYSTAAAIAVFKYPVIGEIMFIQRENQSETSVFAHLDYNDGRSGTKNHKWEIKTNTITNDSLSTDEALRCLSTGPIYSPQTVLQQLSQSQYNEYCSKNSPLGCKLGDLSGKLGLLNIRNAASSDTSTRQFFTNVNLPLSGPSSVIGKSVAIMNEQGTSILACANIQILHDPYLFAKFSMGTISGSVYFSQQASFGAKKTFVINDLSGLTNTYRFWIYELPPAVGNNVDTCYNLGKVFNPLNITQYASNTATDDKYMVGDLSRYGILPSWISYNLPLTGLTSINKRSLVIVDEGNQNKIVACATIDSYSPVVVSQAVEAVSTFTGAVSGTVHLYQTIYADGTMSDTSVLVDLNNTDGHQSLRHNWHAHLTPIQGDANAEQPGRCMSAKAHFDPYMTMKNQTNYAIECRPENPFRCELGDQASKLSTYDVGMGRKMFTDVDLPLTGNYSVQGRSMVLHVQEQGAARMACADIIPVTYDSVPVELKSPTTLDRHEIAKVYAGAIKANPTDVVVELISESEGMTKIKVHFLGFQRSTIKDRFVMILNGKDKNSLSPYIPDTGAAHHIVVSTVLLMMVFAVHLLNYL